MTKREAMKAARGYMDEILYSVVRKCSCGEWFFSTNRKWKYCCDGCAKEAERMQKLRWWHENKGQLRS